MQLQAKQELSYSQIISNDNEPRRRDLDIEYAFRVCFRNTPDYTCSEIIEPIIYDLENEGVDCSTIWQMYDEKLKNTKIVSKKEAQRMYDQHKIIKNIKRT